MRDLFRAEWIKIAGNRWATLGLIWIYPIVAVALITLVAVVLLLSSEARANFGKDDVFQWTTMAIGTWNLPNHPFLRIILLGFTSVVFAGEYQWNTWKNTVPRSQRTTLIVVKFVTLAVFVVFVFVLMSVIVSGGWGLLTQLAGSAYGPALTGDVVSQFARDYTVQAVTTFTSVMIAAGYAALAGMFTRSILGGVVVSFIATTAEGLSIIGLAVAGSLLDIPRVVELYRFTPTYNILNVLSWINEDHALKIDVYEDGRVILSDPLAFSLLLLTLWVVGLVALVAWLFRRQDITS